MADLYDVQSQIIMLKMTINALESEGKYTEALEAKQKLEKLQSAFYEEHLKKFESYRGLITVA